MALEEAAVASLNPDEMLAGGLADDFRGKITSATYTRWDYDGSIDEPVLAAKLVIESEEYEKPVVQHWSAGNLDAFVPSQDGKTPCDDDEEGPYALKVGKKTGLNNNTNFAHLMSAILDAGKASKKFTTKDLTASLECLVGLDAQWNRVPQKKRSGLAQAEGEEGKRRSSDVLVVTEVFDYSPGKVNGKAGKPVSVKSKKQDEEEEETEESEKDPLDLEIEEAIVDAARAADGKVKRGKLANLMLKAFSKDAKKKSKAVKRCTEEEFLEAGPWSYDSDTGVIEVPEED